MADRLMRELRGLLGHPPTWGPTVLYRADGTIETARGSYPWSPSPRQSRDHAKKLRRAIGDLPKHPDERLSLFHRELGEAGPTLRELVGRADALTPAVRAAIVKDWNQAIDDHDWRMLTAFCEICSKPVERRQDERLGGANKDSSTVCSEVCRETRKNRRKSAARRLRDKLK